MTTYHYGATTIRRVEQCPDCHGRGGDDGGACRRCRGIGAVEGADVTCPNPRCRAAISKGTWEPDPNCATCGGSGVKGEHQRWSGLRWTSQPKWMENPLRPYFGPLAGFGIGAAHAEVVRVISMDEEAYWMSRYEKVNLRLDSTDPAYSRAVPIRIVESAAYGVTPKLIRFSDWYDEQLFRYRDVRVVGFPP